MNLPQNPYIAGNPVGGGPAFVGREDVMQAVLRVLRDPQHHGIVLYGQRRIGKTSILHHLAEWLPKQGKARAVYFDLQDKAAWPIGKIMGHLAEDIAEVLELPEPVVEGEGEEWFRKRWLPGALGALPAGESLVVLLDEFDVLADAESQREVSASVFKYLGELLNICSTVAILFVIGRNLEDVVLSGATVVQGAARGTRFVATARRRRKIDAVNNQWQSYVE
ncbi:MAG: AAA family ATPase [Byssovorax sp.]